MDRRVLGERHPADIFIVALGVGCALALLLVAAAELPARLTQGQWVPVGAGDWITVGLGSLAHPLAPAEAWPAGVRGEIPGTLLYWTTLLALLAIAGGAALAVRRWATAAVPRSRQGFAERHHVKAALGRDAARRSAPVTRPSIAEGRARLDQVSLDLGRELRTGQRLHGILEDSYLLLGPPRCGKGVTFLIPNLVTFPGPAVVTSTRDDLFLHTSQLRSGPVYLFDPTEICAWPTRVRWSPITGCADPLNAILRAGALVTASPAAKGVTDPHHWSASAQAVLRCFLHAAALGQRDMRAVKEWAFEPANTEPYDILFANDRAAEGWAGELKALVSTPWKERGSIFSAVRRALDALADPRVLTTSCPDPQHPQFDPGRFLDERGTLYLVGTSSEQLSMAPLITAMVESVVEEARRRAARTPGRRLDPPLGLFLDEASQIALLPSLPSLVSDGGGSGITTIVVLQSLGQARGRWGPDAADTLWDASTVKLIYGGLSSDSDLKRVSRLCGDIEERVVSSSRGKDGHWSETVSSRKGPAMTEAQVRELPMWQGLLFYRSLKVVETALPGWWDRPGADAIRAAAARVEEGATTAS